MYSQQQQQQQQPKIPSYFISSTTMLEAQQIQPKQQRKDSNQVWGCRFGNACWKPHTGKEQTSDSIYTQQQLNPSEQQQHLSRTQFETQSLHYFTSSFSTSQDTLVDSSETFQHSPILGNVFTQKLSTSPLPLIDNTHVNNSNQMSLNSHQRTKSLLVNPEAGQLKNIRDQHAENAFTRYMSSFGSQSRPESPSKHFSNLSASGYFSDSGTTTTQLEGDVRHHTRHNHGIDVFNLHGNPLHRSHSMPQKEQSLKGEDQKQMLGEYGILSHQRHHNQFQNQSLNHHQSERHSNFQLNHSTQNQYNQYQQQQQQQQQIHNHLSAIQVNSIQQQSNYNENHNQYSQVESSAMHDMNHTLLNPVTFKNGLHLQRNKMMSTSKPISEQLPLLPETPKNNTLYLKTHDNIFASTCRYWYSATCNRGLACRFAHPIPNSKEFMIAKYLAAGHGSLLKTDQLQLLPQMVTQHPKVYLSDSPDCGDGFWRHEEGSGGAHDEMAKSFGALTFSDQTLC